MLRERVRILNKADEVKGPIVYWMQRDQRVDDNWALIEAVNLAEKNDQPLIVVFNLVSKFLEASLRQYSFMIEGLKEVEAKLSKLNIPFKLLIGKPANELLKFIKEIDAGILVTDFNPLKIIKVWKNKVAEKIDIPFYEVDAHNIVPCWEASDKLEYAAYTIRPKIKKQLDKYLDDFPSLKKLKLKDDFNFKKVNWKEVYDNLEIDKSIKPVEWIKPGEQEAKKMLKDFLSNKLPAYDEERNDPNKEALSNLSPYLHFGQISAQRAALEAQPFIEHKNSQESFLEELIIRRELSDNFCHYNNDYDSFDGFHDWAKKTLNEHRDDEREYVYTQAQFEKAETHDPLWNAAQTEMVETGKMHGYMRMYWAKKILEWTKTPEEALSICIYLNDKYELDGRDPNGYVGAAWSVGGVHDRAWTERPVLGKIRYMNYNGCKRKFDVKSYIKKYIPKKQNSLFD
ncbi:MAG: deoxyribodipyrimidine photo-lyase [Ignavibacteriae bacterium]|nr:deoxyribodipyrimidine photo-lyase [Ignavibacteriota bacterium]NOG99190.1 deoxyribodipyrimidine photo-lyase [Ignavibacteriota bacterium]